MTSENLPFPDAPKGANKAAGARFQGPARRQQKARIHTGGVPRLQLKPLSALIYLGVAMRYIDKILQPGETVLYAGKLHWIIYIPAMIMMLLAVGSLAGLAAATTQPTAISWMFVAGALTLAGGVTLASAWFKRWTTEIDVTNRRVVYKRGFIKRHTVEMNMDKVASVDVDQSIFGRLLNFGDITIHGTGENIIERLHNIGAPLDFRNHVTAR